MVPNLALYAVVGLAVALAGMGLALIGLGLARQDVAAVRLSGVNGLVLYLARAGRRSWLARCVVQAVLLVFALLVIAAPRAVAPAGAADWQGAALELRRWLLTLASAVICAQSALDLWARRTAERIARAAGE